MVFEELYGPDGGKIAEHKDIEDAGQTVVVDNPDTPEAPDAPKPGMPKTGDEVPWIPIASLAGAAACATGIALLVRRHDDVPDGHGGERPWNARH